MDLSKITNNKKNGQFEYKTEEHLAYLTYRLRKKTMFFMHTTVPEELAGQGLASALALEALNYAKEKGYLIAVMCPFVSGYVKKHPEWYELYDGEYHERFRKPRRP